jgi:DNA-binding XRE family transcriptional regulator
MFDTRLMSEFAAYIAKTDVGRTHAEWARHFGISRSHFTMIRNGTALPSRKLAAKIEALTKGRVKAHRWPVEAARAATPTHGAAE